jgi:hypothetical protein
MPWWARAAAVAYVVGVAILAGIATADPHDIVPWAWAAAFALTVPSTVLLVPAIFVVVPLAWRVSDLDNGGPTWPTTLAYVGCFTFAAVVQVALVLVLVRAVRRRRQG